MSSMIELIEVDPIVIKYRSQVDVKIKYRDFDRVDSLFNKIYFDFDVIDALTSKTIATFNQKAIKKNPDLTAVATDIITWKNYPFFGKNNQIDRILEYMGSKTKLNVRIKVYSDNTDATGVSYCDTTLSISTADIKPDFDIMCMDTDENTINVTGDPQKLINMLSKMTISCENLDTYGASIKNSKFYIDGILKAAYSNGTTTLNTVSVTKSANNGFDYAPFNIRVELTDSRGAVSLVTKDFQLINYSLPSFSKWTVKRYNNTDRNIQAILEGSVSPIIIDGVAKNRIESIDFRYKLTRNTFYGVKSSVEGITQLTDDTFEFSSNSLLNLDQKNSYNLQLYVTDSLSTSKALNFTISKTSAFMSFRNNERLGINNTNPKYTVDMNGDMNVNGKMLINGADVTSSINSVASEIGLILGIENNRDILGLQADYENKKFTRLAGAVGLNAGEDFNKFSVYGGMKRCNVSDNGTITAYYGDENYADDGSNGQVMVYIPKFYYKVVPLKLEQIQAPGFGYHIRKANYYITDKALAGFKIHPAFINEQGEEADYFLYSAYEGSLYMSDTGKYYSDADYKAHSITGADKISSVAGKKPVTGQATSGNNGNGVHLYRNTAEACAGNRGPGWHDQTVKSLSALQLLMLMECGTLNVQSALSMGICNIGKDYLMNFCANTGSTSSFGNKSGTASSTIYRYYDKETNKAVTENQTAANRLAVSYRGIENPYGNTFKWIQGVNFWGDGTMAGGQAYVCDDFNFTDNKNNDNYSPVGFTVINAESASDYISAFGYGNEKYDWIFLATEINGTSALPVGDKAYGSVNLNAFGAMNASGAWNSINAAGIFSQSLNLASNYKNCHLGCRLIYVPQN